MMILVYGGSGNGKSTFAESLAKETKKKKIYLATMSATDPESLERICLHRKKRAGENYETIELPYGISACLDRIDKDTLVLLECVTNLVANEMFLRPEPIGTPKEIVQRIVDDIRKIKAKAGDLIVVANNVFADEGDYLPETKTYIQIHGEVNQILAKEADSVYEVVAGIPLLIKQEETWLS